MGGIGPENVYKVTFDPGASIILIKDKELFQDLDLSKQKSYYEPTHPCVTHGAGHTLFGYGHYNPDSRFNLIGENVAKHFFNIFHDTTKDDAYVLTNKVTGKTYNFHVSQNGLYETYVTQAESRLTVAGLVNPDCIDLTADERDRAFKARQLHCCLHHPSDASLITLIKSGTLVGCPVTPVDVRHATMLFGQCRSCDAGKRTTATNIPYPLSTGSNVGEMLHLDIIFVKTGKDRLPLLLSVEDSTNYGLCRPLKTKHNTEVLKAMHEILNHFTALEYRITKLSTDPESVFTSLLSEINNIGVQLEHTPTGCHEVRVERYVRILRERVRAFLADAHYRLPLKLLPLLVQDIVYCLNLTPNGRTNGLTPHSIVTGSQVNFHTDVSRIVFGQFVDVKLATPHDATCSRTYKALIVGRRYNQPTCAKLFNLTTGNICYSSNFKHVEPTPADIALLEGFGIEEEYDIDQGINYYSRPIPSEAVNQQQVVSSQPLNIPHVQFPTSVTHENNDVAINIPVTLPLLPKSSSGDEATIQLPETDVPQHPQHTTTTDPQSSHPPPTPTVTIRRSSRLQGRIGSSIQQYQERITKLDEAMLIQDITAGCILVDTVNNMSISQAMQTYPLEALESINKEITQLFLTQKALRPIRAHDPHKKFNKILPLLTFLKEKFNSMNIFEKLKARSCIGGHLVDRDLYLITDTSSPTVSPECLLACLVIAIALGWLVRNADIPGAFLFPILIDKHTVRINRELTQLIINLIPKLKKFVQPDGSMLCETDKAVYGLPESAKLFHDHLNTQLAAIGFIVTETDACIFYDDHCIICLHVDDLLILSENSSVDNQVLAKLKSAYGNVTTTLLTESTPLSYLGMKISRSHDGSIDLSMPGYTANLMTEFSISHVTSVPCSKSITKPLAISESNPSVASRPFLSLLMKLLYLAKRIRPDLLYSISTLATRSQSPTSNDYECLIKILQYLNGTQDFIYRIPVQDSLQLCAYIDASYNAHPDSKGHSGISLFLGSVPIFTKSVKQKMVSTSSTECEIIAIFDAMPYILKLRNLLTELGIDQQPTVIKEDNLSTIQILTSNISSMRTVHYRNKVHFIHQFVHDSTIKFEYCPTREMCSDILTKPLFGSLFTKFREVYLTAPLDQQSV